MSSVINSKPKLMSQQTMEQHLQAFLEAFVTKRYQADWVHKLTKSKPSDNLLLGMDALYRELDMRYCKELPKGSAAQDIAFVRTALGPNKILTGYVLSADEALNRQTMPVAQALEMIVGRSNTSIISFAPGKLAYFEGHSVGERYLCVR
jgi:hypothetical protein